MGKNKIEAIKEKLVPVLKFHGVRKAGIFGSYARGEQKRKSDVDILVEVGDGVDLIDFIKLKNILEKVINRKVDLVEYECVREEIRDNILRDEVPIIR